MRLSGAGGGGQCLHDACIEISLQVEPPFQQRELRNKTCNHRGTAQCAEESRRPTRSATESRH
eukprot:39607-Chlamydomonas_euryale.AAC.4